MTRHLLKKSYLVKVFMNNISDKSVLIAIFLTIFVVFAFAFSVKSPERKIIESPIMWKEDFSKISINDTEKIMLNKSFYF